MSILAAAAAAAASVRVVVGETVYPVTDYGSWIADDSSSSARETNRATMANAIASVGAIGGGIITIPSGHYYLQQRVSGGLFLDEGAILINQDNITLRGAGIGKTVLHSRSEFSVQAGEVMRGFGIEVVGTSSSSVRRVGTVIERLELTADLGHTGNYTWPANTTTGDGWDVTNKGIWWHDGGSSPYVGDVTIRDVYVHSYRGEVLYVGGPLTTSITLERVWSSDSNGSMFNMGAETMSLDDCQFGPLARFWWEFTEAASMTWTVSDCTFADSRDASAGVSSENINGNGTVVIDGCRFIDAGSIYGMYGNVHIDATVQNCYFETAQYDCIHIAQNVQGEGSNDNLTFQNNTIIDCPYLLLGYGESTNDFLIDGNDYTGQGAGSYLFFTYGTSPTYSNVVYSNNTRRNTGGDFPAGKEYGTFTNNTAASPVNDSSAPSVPQSLAATAGCDASVWLTWTPSTDAIGVSYYNIYRDGGGTPVGIAYHRWYMDRGSLSGSTQYSYTVTAVDFAGNESSPSNTAQATTP